jgi:hypothetical protein
VANYEPGSNSGRDRGGKPQRMQHQLRAQTPPLKPLIDAEARHHERRHRHAVQVEAAQRPHRPSRLHLEQTQPVATHHPTAVTGDLDDHTLLPVGPDGVLPQPAIHRGITAVEVRPVMSARMDPLDPDGIHNPAVFQPARASRIEASFRPAQPAKTPAEKRSTTRKAGRMVLHLAHPLWPQVAMPDNDAGSRLKRLICFVP